MLQDGSSMLAYRVLSSIFPSVYWDVKAVFVLVLILPFWVAAQLCCFAAAVCLHLHFVLTSARYFFRSVVRDIITGAGFAVDW